MTTSISASRLFSFTRGAVIGVLVAIVMACGGDRDGEPPTAGTTTAVASAPAELTKTITSAPADLPYGRTGIDVCVALSPRLPGAVAPAAAAQLVKTAMDSVATSAAGQKLGLDRLQRSASAGCPDGYVSPPAGIDRDPALPALRGRVTMPLRTSTVVFVVGDDEASILGPVGFARAPYESICDGHVCSEVTTALFVTRAVLESPDSLRLAMVVGLGVDPTGGRYPNGRP